MPYDDEFNNPVCVCVQGEEELELCSTELLYQGILPSLPQYMVRDWQFTHQSHWIWAVLILTDLVCVFVCVQIALLKILLAAAPTSKAKTDSINILADVLPEEMP